MEISTHDVARAQPSMALRDYQNDLIEDARAAFKGGARRVLAQAATGAGKTVIAAEMTRRAVERGASVRFIVHRAEIMKQTLAKLAAFGLEADIVGHTPGWQTSPLAVGMVITAAKHGLGKCHVIVIDEAHHGAKGTVWDKAVGPYERARILGLTATPRRLDGKGLDSSFDVLVQGPPTVELIEQGHLAAIDPWHDPAALVTGLRSITQKTPLEEIREVLHDFTENAIDIWEKKGGGDRTIAFCASVRAAEYTAERFRARGIPAESVDGKLGFGEREAILARYARGETRILTNCDLVSEGFDVPETGVVMQMRSTASLTLHYQQVGRGMRPKQDGRPMVLLDLAGCIKGSGKRKGLGLPTDVVSWTLEGKPKTAEQIRSEFARSEEKRIEEEARAEHSGEIERVPTCLDEARTWRFAKEFVEKPEDLLTVKRICRKRDGGVYSNQFLVRQCAEMFFYPKKPWKGAVKAAAKALNMMSPWQIERAFRESWSISEEPALAEEWEATKARDHQGCLIATKNPNNIRKRFIEKLAENEEYAEFLRDHDIEPTEIGA